MTELPNADYTFPPVIPPIDYELRRIEAAALLLEPCPHCNATTEAVAGTGSLPRALGITHEKGCPDFWELE